MIGCFMRLNSTNVFDDSHKASVEAFANFAKDNLGTINYWINNAGINGGRRSFLEVPVEQVEAVVKVRPLPPVPSTAPLIAAAAVKPHLAVAAAEWAGVHPTTATEPRPTLGHAYPRLPPRYAPRRARRLTVLRGTTQVNLLGALLCTQYAMKVLTQQTGVTSHLFNTVGSGVKGGGTPGDAPGPSPRSARLRFQPRPTDGRERVRGEGRGVST
jgi:NAD(P)-dependent dehydrogenase (short-subunit alcohol dehydrogenase family)